ncbi:MAG: membrane protein insertase YidC [Alphaproteobacteria bacterium]
MDQKNLFLALALSLLVLLGWQYYMDNFVAPPPAGADTPADLPRPDLAPGAEAVAPAGVPLGREETIAEGRRLPIEAPRVHGSINLTGARIDDLTLADYRETTDAESPEIVLLSPMQAPNPYFAEFGWLDEAGRQYGGGDTPWQSGSTALGVDAPVTLTWESADGLLFRREIAVDANYMFTITDRVQNRGTAPVTLFPYGRVRRIGTPDTLGFYILHEGPLGVFNSTLEEVDYDDLQDEGRIESDSTGGWIGITDKYWLAAVIPEQSDELNARFTHSGGDADAYQTDYLGAGRALSPGGEIEYSARLFAGAKEARLLDGYRDELGIDRFDLAIDFGWFFYITKPMFFGLLYLSEWLGNFGLAILALTVMIKLVFFPLANKSYASMSRMKALQPQMTELRERYGEDKQKMQQELMGLYKREKVNPVSGCLPIALQIPVFFALYKVLFVTIEMRHAPFFGWIEDLSAQDPTNIFTLFGLIPWDPPSFLMLGIWPLIMGGTMFLQMKLNPAPADPIQAKMFMLMPVVFTILLARFPAGLVIYWAWNNLLSIAQQYVIMRRMGVPIGGGKVQAAAAPAPASGAKAGAHSRAGNSAGRRKAASAKADGAAQGTDGKARAAKGTDGKARAAKGADGKARAAKGTAAKGQTGRRKKGAPRRRGGAGNGAAKPGARR